MNISKQLSTLLYFCFSVLVLFLAVIIYPVSFAKDAAKGKFTIQYILEEVGKFGEVLKI